MESNNQLTKLGKFLKDNPIGSIAEIIFVFLLAFTIIRIFVPFAGENLIIKQLVVWVANILMILSVWVALKLRGENWKSFGLINEFTSWKNIWQVFYLSLLAFALGLAGFLLGSIIMANVTGIPEPADMSNYAFLKDNIGWLILTLLGVYVASSFGEEVIYRAFLINRISGIGNNSKTSKTIAVLLSAVIFGLVHYSWGPMGIVQTGFMGLALGFCYLWFNRRLWILIITHVYMDTILMLQIYFS